MNSKEALKKIENTTNWSSDEDIDKDLYNLWGNVACRTIKKDLEVLEIIKKHNGKVYGYKGKLNENNICVISVNDLTEEEFNVIKEWLENDK